MRTMSEAVEQKASKGVKGGKKGKVANYTAGV